MGPRNLETRPKMPDILRLDQQTGEMKMKEELKPNPTQKVRQRMEELRDQARMR